MTHTGELATVPHTLFLIAMAWTFVGWLIAWRRGAYWPTYLIFGATSCGMMALWFAGLALTSGDTPIMPRTQAAEVLRLLELAAAVVWLAFNIAWTLSGLRIERKQQQMGPAQPGQE